MTISVDVDLNIGTNTISWREASGYADLEATINVTESMLSCISMNGGVCSLVAPEPYISFPSTWALKGWLAEAVADIASWIVNQGGAEGLLGNKSAYFEIKDGFAGIEDLGFTVTKSDVFLIKDYYAGVA